MMPFPYIEAGIVKARKLEKICIEQGYNADGPGPQHWRGYEAALVNLRRKMRRARAYREVGRNKNERES